MEIQITCPNCGSGIEVLPSVTASQAKCDQCQHLVPVQFTTTHEEGLLEQCPVCQRKDFYTQKDFRRWIGISLFVIASILSIWTYGLSFVVLYAFDFFLFRKLNLVAVCYQCRTNFRKLKNMDQIPGFDHEMNDRIVYSGHDFQGKPPKK